ncbi:MAG: hypothetical protein GYA36_02555 [Veillonellaceae bacterium]|nr:hypothetical protein [Veillonellaceae bacterium]
MRRWNRRGSAVVAAMIALTILTCLGGTLAVLLRTETDSSQNFLEGIAAQGLAEAGLRRAIVVLYKNGNPHGLAETLNRDGWSGSYRITTSTEGTALRVRSNGRVGAAARSVSVLVSLTLNPRPDGPLTELTVLSWDN